MNFRLKKCIAFAIFCTSLIGCGSSNRQKAEEYFAEGVKYKTGHEGYEQDTKKALEYFQKAADLGQPDAQYEMGAAYESGLNCGQDNAKAFCYYLQSAKQKNLAQIIGGHHWDYRAQLATGMCYMNGKGVKKNFVEGIAWLIIADQRQGLIPGFLDKQKKKLAAEQIVAAEKRAKELCAR